jgi:hypothetical protein
MNTVSGDDPVHVPFDLFVCMGCGRTVKTPSVSDSHPGIDCWCSGRGVSIMTLVVSNGEPVGERP